MPLLIVAILAFVRSLLYSLRDPKFRGLVLFTLIIILSGTVFYHNTEKWSYLDALYFCIVTLATVGYGDFVPKTTPGKIFTMIFIILGIGAFLAFVNAILTDVAKRHSEKRTGRDN